MKKQIYVLGGMGPEASVYMYKTLIEMSVSEFGARNNSDFPEIVLHSVPVPDFISSENEKIKAFYMLKTIVSKLKSSDIGSLSIACNTAHLLLENLQKNTKIQFTSMIDSVVKEVKHSKVKIVGILGTPSTLKSQLYQKSLLDKEIRSLIPNDGQIRQLEKIIRNVISNKIDYQDKVILKKIADDLVKKGAQGIVLGCTELPLVFPKTYKAKVFNSVEILSKNLLLRYYSTNN